jgi:hypothetical protein|tara:strand:- start:447 stop:1595 length:1149 start_codon:yes stop_codon:yes gene_type:complete
MMNNVKLTIQKELANFMDLVSGKTSITKSAYSQSRVQLKPEAFIDLNNILVEEFYTDNTFNLWKGHRLCAIDGSTVNLPFSEDIVETFGTIENKSRLTLPSARISSFYDVLNGIIIDSQIEHYETSEYDLSINHFPKHLENDLVIFDRGYGAIWWFYYLHSKNIDYVVRVQKNFIREINDFWSSGEMSRVMEITRCPHKSEEQMKKRGLDFTPFTIRFVKVILPNGEVEVLATSLLDEVTYPTSEFGELYFKRWSIEVNYDHLKNNIELENFTGLSSITIKQDFFANMLIANIQALIARDAQRELEKEKKGAKWKYKVNRNLSLGFMKDRVVKILLRDDPHYFEELKKLFKLEPVPIRPGRKYNRRFHATKRKFHMTKKRSI